ncbi:MULTISPECIES: DUF3833 family protein [Rhizobium/Agrobacterium group]|uniref:DUF3833 family protein n=2 Tax=Rhizobium/Agrobacterium group TaxID=227290 RepID=B9JY07_ALLAM|nr:MULTISPECIES: DUF3833 family protein [Rhizobium/Agrobacterium group]ACM35037.1 conserved hypothetical protein [Allorhizobium ampelinum S4]MCF1447407.1 DUF3833 family protein [Allorhizobium ampelinum]MCF1495640.1 DUF3833 family protein [Allorhizobium ampelinum]MUO27819.1 DUF3833 family protein [Agrobacterium vitis]MUO41145.1 DUF3833 family protein [Agrobacterium vitis]
MSGLKSALFGLSVGLFSSVGAATAADFTFEDYFVGKTVAEGHFAAINGVSRKFTVDLTGKWDGHVLTLREDFRFEDGTRDRKTWRFIKTGPTTYSGTREDVVGNALVRLSGDTARFNYLVYLSPETQSNKVRFYDKMVLKPDGTVLNTAWVTKFGFPVAKTTVSFHKAGHAAKVKAQKHLGIAK